MKNLLKRYGDLIRYILVGGVTTLISIVSFIFLIGPLGIHYTLSNILSWILSVSFAFFASKWFVFQSTSTHRKVFLKEAAGFFASRLVTLGVEEGLMILLIFLLHLPEVGSKIFCNVVVVILNYIFSKFLVFKKKKG